MKKMKILGIVLIIAVFGYVVGARYTNDSKNVLNTMRQHAPAHTLMYLESQSNSAFIEFMDQYIETINQLIPELTEQLDTSLMPEKLAEFYSGYFELFSTLSKDGMAGMYEKFSIALDGYSVFYLDGLMPVMHVEIIDKEKFEMTFNEFSKSLQSITVASVNVKAWPIPGTDLKVVIHNNEQFVTIALIDDKFDEQRKAKILALTAEEQSIIDTKELVRINEQYQYNMVQGFINIEQIVASLLGENLNVEQDINAFGFDRLDSINASISNECKNEYLQIIKTTPKIVFGAKNIVLTQDNLTMDFNSTLEIHNLELAQSLMTLNGHIPEYVNSTDAMFSFYYASELSNVVGFMNKWVPVLSSSTFECDHLLTLQENVSPSLISKAALGMQMVKTIKSIGGTLFNADLGKMNDFKGLDALVSVHSSDPKNLALLASNVPQLQGVKISQTPAEIPLMSMMFSDEEAFVQIAGNAIVAYSGDQSQLLVEQISAESLNQNGLIAMRIDYADYMDLMMGAIYSGNLSGVLSADQCLNSYKSMSLMKDFIGYMTMNFAFSENGFEMNYSLEYNKVQLQDRIEPGTYELTIFDDCSWTDPDKEIIHSNGTGYYEVTEIDEYSDESCIIIQADYNWTQENNSFKYTETNYEYRDYCEDEFIKEDVSVLESYDCEIYKINASGFECTYYDEEYDMRSLYRYRLMDKEIQTQ
ncbi:hypothetical protein [Marinicellulosiphila megalodicopiae]|uniref:hypothetical protein n=1 Tax=Marinicellulosiphila megalodicopiae TaxID=2724896 RepID=UPI003BAE281C